MHTHFAIPKLRIGLFSIGLEAYWAQFDGLKDRLTNYNEQIAVALHRDWAEVVNLGLVDTPEAAVAAGHQFRQSDVDIIFLHVATYALSATVLPVVRRAKVPVIILNLAPGEAIDYARFNSLPTREEMTGEWLRWCQTCPVPEIANVFRRCRIPFFQVTGMLENDKLAWTAIEHWLQAAKVASAMEHNRLGVMGQYYGGMLDIYTDLTLQCATFGGHIEMLEIDELSALRTCVSPQAIAERVQEFRTQFAVEPDCSAFELERAARTSIALDMLVEKHALGSLAYYGKGSGSPANEDTMSSIILGTSLLTARGVPVAGEYEVKNAQAMKIMDLLGAGGSFTEYYATDFSDDIILMGHDGPGHIAMAEQKPKVRPLQVYHGKVGLGLSVEMSVKKGPVTLLSVVDSEPGRIKFVMAEGESVPGPILEIGNTNSRYRFSPGARRFVEEWSAQGPAHHCAVGVGHVSRQLDCLARLLEIEAVQIC
jgi:L-arabinose isomerase